MKPKVNEVCRDCLKWKQFGDKCYVWWPDKKVCTQKVKTTEEWDLQKKTLKSDDKKDKEKRS